MVAPFTRVGPTAPYRVGKLRERRGKPRADATHDSGSRGSGSLLVLVQRRPGVRSPPNWPLLGFRIVLRQPPNPAGSATARWEWFEVVELPEECLTDAMDPSNHRRRGDSQAACNFRGDPALAGEFTCHVDPLAHGFTQLLRQGVQCRGDSAHVLHPTQLLARAGREGFHDSIQNERFILGAELACELLAGSGSLADPSEAPVASKGGEPRSEFPACGQCGSVLHKLGGDILDDVVDHGIGRPEVSGGNASYEGLESPPDLAEVGAAPLVFSHQFTEWIRFVVHGSSCAGGYGLLLSFSAQLTAGSCAESWGFSRKVWAVKRAEDWVRELAARPWSERAEALSAGGLLDEAAAADGDKDALAIAAAVRERFDAEERHRHPGQGDPPWRLRHSTLGNDVIVDGYSGQYGAYGWLLWGHSNQLGDLAVKLMPGFDEPSRCAYQDELDRWRQVRDANAEALGMLELKAYGSWEHPTTSTSVGIAADPSRPVSTDQRQQPGPGVYHYLAWRRITDAKSITDWARRLMGDESQQISSARCILTAFCRVARVLAELHRVDLVHRDIKPDNIVVGAQDRAYLVDLGLASSPTADLRGRPPYYCEATERQRRYSDDVRALLVVMYEAFEGQIFQELRFSVLGNGPLESIRRLLETELGATPPAGRLDGSPRRVAAELATKLTTVVSRLV